jgi:hypothetical protein
MRGGAYPRACLSLPPGRQSHTCRHVLPIRQSVRPRFPEGVLADPADWRSCVRPARPRDRAARCRATRPHMPARPGSGTRCEPQVGQDLRAAFDEVADMLRLEEVGRIRRDLACPQEPAGGRALAVATAVERPGFRVQIRGYPSDGCSRSGQELRTSRLQLPPRRTTRSVSLMSDRNTGHASFAGETLIIRQRPMDLTGQPSNPSKLVRQLVVIV